MFFFLFFVLYSSGRNTLADETTGVQYVSKSGSESDGLKSRGKVNALKSDLDRGRKHTNLIKHLAERSGDSLADLSGHVLLLRHIIHQVIYLANVPKK